MFISSLRDDERKKFLQKIILTFNHPLVNWLEIIYAETRREKLMNKC